MPPPYVTKVGRSATGQITFNVLIDGLTDQDEEKEFIEISGAATQVGGAFAMINQVVPTPENVDENGTGSVTLTVDPSPAREFRKDQDITVFIRISKVWVTVLGGGLPPGDPEGRSPLPDGERRWGILRADSQMYAPKPPTDGP
jgi:hypothetical protein